MVIKRSSAKVNNLGTDPIGPLIMRMAFPVMLAQLVNALYNIVDRIYIGHIPGIGKAALAGLGVTFPILILITAVQSLISVGGSTWAAIAMGEHRQERAEQILGASGAMLILLALLLMVGFQIIKEPMLFLFGASKDTISYALEYLGIYLCGTIPIMLALGLNPFISLQGFTIWSMYTMLIGAVLNIILDPIFIFIFDMGIAGAALATVIAQMVSAAWVIRFLMKRGSLRIRLHFLKLNWRVLRPVLAVGLAPFAMQSTECILNVVFNSSLQFYGGDIAIGAFTIASSATQTMTILFNGFTQGIQPIISYNYGADNSQRVRQVVRLVIGITAAMGVVIWLITELCPMVFVLLFNNEKDLVSYAIWAMRVYTGGFCVLGVQHSCQHVLVALGQTKTSLFLALLRKAVLLIPMIYILPHFMSDQVFAVLSAEPIADVLAACTTSIVFYCSFGKIMWRREEQCRKEIQLKRQVDGYHS